MDAVILTVLSVLLVSVISAAGVIMLAVAKKRMHVILLLLVAFSAGALFGDAFLHLLPDAAETGFTSGIAMFVLLGVTVSFVVEKMVQWTHCHVMPSKKHVHNVAYMNLFGDGVHNFIDGLIIAASYLASIPLGIATTVAVVFHEIPQEIGDFGVLLHGGFTKKKAIFMNFLSAVAAIVGAAAALFIGTGVEGLLAPMVAFAAGNFIYIAGADLIPELHKDCSRIETVLQLVMFLVGIAIMYLLLFLEI